MPDPIQFFANSSSGNTAEFEFISAVVARLRDRKIPALIVCQPPLGDKTPDFLLVINRYPCLIDVKTARGSIVGSFKDGKWANVTSSGRKTAYPNLLRLLKGQKENLCDEMRGAASALGLPGIAGDFKGGTTAVAAFWPKLPPGSTCERDPGHRDWYQVVDADDFIASLGQEQLPSVWTMDQWRQFITHHLRCPQVSGLEEFRSNELREASREVAEYRRSFLERFTAHLGPLAADRAEHDHLRAALAGHSQVHVFGPSGSGKSQELMHAAVEEVRRGALVVFVSGEAYAGHFQGLLESAVAGYLDVHPAAFLKNLHLLTHIRKVLIVDAVDTVSTDRSQALIRDVAAECDRGVWDLVVYSSKSPNADREMRLPAFAVEFAPMSGDFRASVFKAHDANAENLLRMKPLIAIASNGFEVRALAQLAGEIALESSMNEVFSQFIRRLSPQGREHAARDIFHVSARAMEAEFSQTLSEDAFHRIAVSSCRASNEPAALIDEILQRGAIRPVAGGRVRFMHERLQEFVAAETVAETIETTEDLVRACREPRTAHLTPLLVGFPHLATIDSFAELNSAGLLRSDVLQRLVEGYYGARLREDAFKAARNLLTSYGEFLSSAKYSVIEDERETAVGLRRDMQLLGAGFALNRPIEKLGRALLDTPALFEDVAGSIADLVVIEEQKVISCLEGSLNGSKTRSAMGVFFWKLSRQIWPEFSALGLLLSKAHRCNVARDDNQIAQVANLPQVGILALPFLATICRLKMPLDPGRLQAEFERWEKLCRSARRNPGRVFAWSALDLTSANSEGISDLIREDTAFRRWFSPIVADAREYENPWTDKEVIGRWAEELKIVPEPDDQAEAIELEKRLRVLGDEKAFEVSWQSLKESAEGFSRESVTEYRARAIRSRYSYAVEYSRMEPFDLAWKKLPPRLKQELARAAFPCDHTLDLWALDEVFVLFLLGDSDVQPGDLAGLFSTAPWEPNQQTMLSDLGTMQLQAASQWGKNEAGVPTGLFAREFYREGDGGAWVLMWRVVFELSRPDQKGRDEARNLVETLVSEHPLALPDVLSPLLSARDYDRKWWEELKVVGRDLFSSYCAYALKNLGSFRWRVSPEHSSSGLNRDGIVFYLCVEFGDEETVRALDSLVDDPTWGHRAVATLRALKAKILP